MKFTRNIATTRHIADSILRITVNGIFLSWQRANERIFMRTHASVFVAMHFPCQRIFVIVIASSPHAMLKQGVGCQSIWHRWVQAIREISPIRMNPSNLVIYSQRIRTKFTHWVCIVCSATGVVRNHAFSHYQYICASIEWKHIDAWVEFSEFSTQRSPIPNRSWCAIVVFTFRNSIIFIFSFRSGCANLRLWLHAHFSMEAIGRRGDGCRRGRQWTFEILLLQSQFGILFIHFNQIRNYRTYNFVKWNQNQVYPYAFAHAYSNIYHFNRSTYDFMKNCLLMIMKSWWMIDWNCSWQLSNDLTDF